ncbi:MobA/MobL family protein [Acinetobacter ursingii]|uniref:MobA/MobL family protein n=1 Tax=Acinetobacter ursingii TaxID=108980 RepID=UPI001957F274|nr:MobA/MobL family protein [Acinetobacter ursingii]VTX88269.1 Mobilization protein A [Acinetobacter ursingii]
MASYHFSVKVGAKGKALAHAEYIEREGEYALKHQEKLEAVGHGNMPEWARTQPNLFWQCADEFERKNGSSYREFEIALPRELNPQQRQALVESFVEQELGEKHAYTWAIHTPKASLEGGEQPHAHIMFSERIQDGIERGADQFFKRYNAKHPERGGCQKSNIAKSAEQRKLELVELRERFADLQNAYLEEYGHSARVDHRSLVDQGIERSPEQHLGWKGSRHSEFKDLVLEYREATRSLDQHLKYLPQYLNHRDQEQSQAEPKKLSHDEKIKVLEQQLQGHQPMVSEYQAMFEKYRKQYVDQVIGSELKKYQAQGKQIHSQIEELDQNKPMLFGKKEWEQQREDLIRDYRQVQHLHEHTKTDKRAQLLYDKSFGRDVIRNYMQQHHTELSQSHAKAQEVSKTLEQLRKEQRQQEREQLQQDQPKSRGYGMRLR